MLASPEKYDITSPRGKVADFCRFMGFVTIPECAGDCWIWHGGTNEQGYGHFKVRQTTIRAHRWIYSYVYGLTQSDQVIRHKCDTPSCVNPLHLEVGTASENMRDMVARGRNSDRKGDRHPMAKIDAKQALEIRRLYDIGHRQSQIADTFGISRALVGKVVRRERWTHI
ncbi:HNH endonuclease [Novosphingobium sp. BL-8A]|uniref:HNH endonuclease n=1 Tax=Novosphingobium sp. BL-8A TaxID=3127639 RepID=UPI003756D195